MDNAKLKKVEELLRSLRDQHNATLSIVAEMIGALAQPEDNAMRQDAGQSARKTILNAREAAAFLEIKLSYLYKRTSERTIPFYKPNHGKIFFKIEELEAIKASGRVATQAEKLAEALAKTDAKKRGRGSL